MCFVPSPVRGEWLLTFICIILGIMCISVTIILLAFSYWKFRVMKYARWLGFVASKCDVKMFITDCVYKLLKLVYFETTV